MAGSVRRGPPAAIAAAAAVAAGAACTGTVGRAPGEAETMCDPGRITLHRLNRSEYNHTIRDLVGVDSRPADAFPDDDIGHGFDNNADVLTVSPLHVEKYLTAAEQVVAAALRVPIDEPLVRRFEAESIGSPVGGPRADGWNLWSNGEIAQPYEFPADGEYRLSARAFATQAGDETARMTLLLDGIELETFDVEAVKGAPATYRHVARVGKGLHRYAVAFINDYYRPEQGKDRNLIVDWLEVEGPLDGGAPGAPAARARIFTCEPDGPGDADCVREILGGFARRAWRRPVEPDEVDRLAELVALAAGEGDGVERGLELALVAVLLSPHFLYRVELDPDPAAADPHPLSDHELAARLSYFLWSSTPDDELSAVADAGGLNDPAAIEAQVARMLADPKAEALIESFGGQWLDLRSVANLEPDYALYPEFDDELRAAMRVETEHLLRELLLEDLPFPDAIAADHTWVNRRLAEHYRLPDVDGEGFVRVGLDGTDRAGLLTHASVLAVTAYPRRTSVVRRGKWVLQRLLCSAPPPPPPEVDALPDEPMPSGSLRERMERHRTDPVCASCHEMMDPIGFGLEHFDVVGAWRDADGGFAVDASGELPGGRTFQDARSLSAILAEDPELPRCTARHLYLYALGRGTTAEDACTIDPLAAGYAEGGQRLPDLVLRVATSEPFRFRRGEPAEPDPPSGKEAAE